MLNMTSGGKTTEKDQQSDDLFSISSTRHGDWIGIVHFLRKAQVERVRRKDYPTKKKSVPMMYCLNKRPHIDPSVVISHRDKKAKE